MSNITNDFKRIQRISSLTTRAIERCFDSPYISHAKCEYQHDSFTLALYADIFSDWQINIDAYDEDAKACAELFVSDLLDSVDEVIKSLEIEEDEIVRENIKDNSSYGESVAIKLSTVLMFKKILESIK